jgi:hypothetical protein
MNSHSEYSIDTNGLRAYIYSSSMSKINIKLAQLEIYGLDLTKTDNHSILVNTKRLLLILT